MCSTDLSEKLYKAVSHDKWFFPVEKLITPCHSLGRFRFQTRHLQFSSIFKMGFGTLLISTMFSLLCLVYGGNSGWGLQPAYVPYVVGVGSRPLGAGLGFNGAPLGGLGYSGVPLGGLGYSGVPLGGLGFTGPGLHGLGFSGLSTIPINRGWNR